MAISPEDRSILLLATKEAAAAFVEDMAHIRQMLTTQEHLPGQIRLLSAILRRLAVDNDLRSIAPPRVGPLSLLVPDNSEIYHAAKKQRLSLFASGGMSVFNCECRALVGGEGREFVLPSDFDRKKLISVSLDGFLTQKVLAFKDNWFSRKQVIKYVANVASGVHSSHERSREDIMLSSLRQYMKLTAHGGGARIDVTWSAYANPHHPTPFTWKPESVDFVLVELLSAAHFLSISPDIMTLESSIRTEFGFPKADTASIA